ncbi:MAG: response regulator [Aureispira sp.]
MIKIILAEDHEVIANSLQLLLESNPGIEVIGNAINGAVLLEQLQAQQPDLILLDISMPVMDGMEAAKKVKELHPDIKVLVLTTHTQQIKIRKILQTGVDGLVLKKSDKAELIHAIQSVMKGNKYYDQAIMDKLINSNGGITLPSGAKITERELEIIQLSADGKSYKEIGELLFLSPETINKYRKIIYSKMEIGGINEMITYAIKNGLID